MFKIFAEPFLVGLSSGLFCFTYCVPFIAPYLVAEERERKENLMVILQFIFGRFFGYIIFGAFFGYLGEKINNTVIDFLINISLMGLALTLLLYTFGLIKEKEEFCLGRSVKGATPAVMGFLMGINICPPFLMSLTYIFTLHSYLLGVIFFTMFFLGTTVYFLPLVFLGFLNKMKEFQAMARISAFLVGIIFLSYGAYRLFYIYAWF